MLFIAGSVFNWYENHQNRRLNMARPKGRPSTKDFICSRIEYDTNGGCWLWSGAMHNTGYGYLYDDNRKTITAHRASYKIFKGPITKGMHVLHSCDIRCCVNPNHLRLGTDQDNVNDMMLRNRVCRGASHPKAKLNDEKILKIIDLFNTTEMSQTEIAQKFNVSRSLIQGIYEGKKWKNFTHLVDKRKRKYQ